jgi:hypothetical protein
MSNVCQDIFSVFSVSIAKKVMNAFNEDSPPQADGVFERIKKLINDGGAFLFPAPA